MLDWKGRFRKGSPFSVLRKGAEMVSMYAIERTKLEGSCMELAKGERLIEDEELPKEMLGRFVKLKKDLGEGSIALIELWTPKVYDSVAPGFSFRMVFPKEGKMWGREQLANWYVSYYPGCCGLMLHHNWMVTVPWLHKGIGTFANIFSQWYVHDKGYTRLMATEAILDRPYSEQIF